MPDEPDLFRTVAAPVGTLLLAAADGGLTGTYFETRRYGPPAARASLANDGTPGRRAARILAAAAAQLEEYFAGARTAFDLPLDSSPTIAMSRDSSA